MYLCSFDVFFFAVAALKSFLKHTITLMFFFFAVAALKSFLHKLRASLHKTDVLRVGWRAFCAPARTARYYIYGLARTSLRKR